jgi:hypothetical protein
VHTLVSFVFNFKTLKHKGSQSASQRTQREEHNLLDFLDTPQAKNYRTPGMPRLTGLRLLYL